MSDRRAARAAVTVPGERRHHAAVSDQAGTSISRIMTKDLIDYRRIERRARPLRTNTSWAVSRHVGPGVNRRQERHARSAWRWGSANGHRRVRSGYRQYYADLATLGPGTAPPEQTEPRARWIRRLRAGPATDQPASRRRRRRSAITSTACPSSKVPTGITRSISIARPRRMRPTETENDSCVKTPTCLRSAIRTAPRRPQKDGAVSR